MCAVVIWLKFFMRRLYPGPRSLASPKLLGRAHAIVKQVGTAPLTGALRPGESRNFSE